MAGKSIDVQSLITPDRLGTEIARYWVEWITRRQERENLWKEVQQYIFATDTTKTTNNKNPWKNKTTLPKLCQIRDNLFSNYMATMFPKRKNIKFIPADQESATKEKQQAIVLFMQHILAQKRFKAEFAKCVLDYIDMGNCFAIPEWVDERVEVNVPPGNTRTQVGYVGPMLRRISPLDIAFNPIASSFQSAPKIIRSYVSMGEIKELLESLTTDENKEAYQELWEYLKKFRTEGMQYAGEITCKDNFMMVDGFTDYRSYLGSNYCEILTFYGDIYDADTDTFLKNYKIMVVDRHKIIDKRPNPSFFGYAPIFHCGWRVRQDSLWAMGPLENLVGVQYRIDHVENLKADAFDLLAFPPLKIKGYVEDFEWGPFARIHVDSEGDVEPMAPPFQVITSPNQELMQYMGVMEELSGSPKEAMGFRTPGEKTAFEVQRLENAASRIFQNKIGQMEEQFTEPLLNALLELGRRNMTSDINIMFENDQLKFIEFMTLTPQDITGNGVVRPYAARHFAEQAELVQNLTNLSQTQLWPTVAPHFSGIKLARILEDIFDLTDYKVVMPYIALAEQADAQRLANAHTESVMMEALQAKGLSHDDYDLSQQQQQQSQRIVSEAVAPIDQGPNSGSRS